MRQKTQRSGTISVQVLDKSTGRSRVLKTIGSSKDPIEVKQLMDQANEWIAHYEGQTVIDFIVGSDEHFFQTVRKNVEQLQLLGPELLLGKLYREIGFDKIDEEMFRMLVISRLTFPLSKLRTVEYIMRYQGKVIDVDKVYRYLDKLQEKQMQLVQQISYEHTLQISGGEIGVVFYDVTTLYFEAEQEDDLRKTGFSKDGKHQHPQILIGLLVGPHGYPLGYKMFEGDKFEGHTMLPVIEEFRTQYQLNKIVIIADAGLLSQKNITALEEQGYEFILGGRIKNETDAIKNQVLAIDFSDGKSIILKKEDTLNLVVSYSSSRARKDEFNRKRGLRKLEKALNKGKLTKKHINNRGYNKYLSLVGEVKIQIDYDKFHADTKWDGLKGYVTNTSLSKEEIIENYKHLWQIEKAFRISKSDLKIRPVYHRLKRRIEAHLCIAFNAYKLYKELERQLKNKGIRMSPEKAIEVLKTIFGLKIKLPNSGESKSFLILKHPDQELLINSFKIPTIW